MYKKDTIITIILSLILLITGILGKIEFAQEDITNFITFLTVYLGFIMTTFAIMAENEEIKKLNTIKDPENNYLMLNGRLANYFKYTFGLGLLAIGLLLISNLFEITPYTSKLILSIVISMGYSSKMPIKLLFDIFLNKKVY